MKSLLVLGVARTLLVAAAVVGSGAVRADSGFRCETGRVVSTGDRKYDVRSKCGEPAAVTQRIAKRKVRHSVLRWLPNGVVEEVFEERQVEITIDRWVYDLGGQRFVRYVEFEDDRVIDVDTGDRGFDAKAIALQDEREAQRPERRRR